MKPGVDNYVNLTGRKIIMAELCRKCKKKIKKDDDTFTDISKDPEVVYHLECAEKTGLYTKCLGFNVEYNYPAVAATGEAVHTMKEAEEIKAKRIKEGYINVRIEPRIE